MKLIHNSRTSAYRNPFGAVPAGGAVHLTLDVEDCVDPEGTLRIWIDGEGESAEAVADAIKMIEEEAQSHNLTEKVKEFLESKLPTEEE